MEKIRIAQVGTNGMTHAIQTFQSIRKQSDVFDLVGIAEPIAEWKKNLTAPAYRDVPQYTVDALLQMDDLDAVAIETNEEHMTEYAQMFAEKGIAVHMDKPGSPDHTAFTKLARTLQSQHLPFHLGYMYRFNPMILRAYDVIAAGQLGDILSVEAHMSCLHNAGNRRWLGRFPGGMMFYLGCHLVDLVYRLQGMPEEVLPMNTVSGVDSVEAEDCGFAVLRYKKGVSFVKTTAVEINGFARRQLVISGTKGTVEIKPLEMVSGAGLQTLGCYTTLDMAKSWADHSDKWETEVYDRYDAMMLDFARLVRKEYENPYDYDYEIRLHELLLRCCGADPV
ncbi:MAG: Gfo/Idh/MocA family oxidoreductase [Clostridia bacterium]|nr:Gfo/Idh/MocA family oxidoreductase [Clostridia bacterium]